MTQIPRIFGNQGLACGSGANELDRKTRIQKVLNPVGPGRKSHLFLKSSAPQGTNRNVHQSPGNRSELSRALPCHWELVRTKGWLNDGARRRKSPM